MPRLFRKLTKANSLQGAEEPEAKEATTASAEELEAKLKEENARTEAAAALLASEIEKGKVDAAAAASKLAEAQALLAEAGKEKAAEAAAKDSQILEAQKQAADAQARVEAEAQKLAEQKIKEFLEAQSKTTGPVDLGPAPAADVPMGSSPTEEAKAPPNPGKQTKLEDMVKSKTPPAKKLKQTPSEASTKASGKTSGSRLSEAALPE